MEVKFNVPLILGSEIDAVNDAIQRGEFSSGGFYTKKCEDQLEAITGAQKVLLTSSCTHALEMCALLINIQEGDEVIMSSYTFVSSANAFALFGAKIVFVDIDPITMNIDAEKAKAAITPKTKAIVLMHYGGQSCDNAEFQKIARSSDIYLIEDAAHCMMAYNRGQHLGTFGDFGTFSFHATKNVHCGEGGALVINNPKFNEVAEVIREKGTNRQSFKRGEISKYNWIKLGSSYLMSEMSAAFLSVQLDQIKKVTTVRQKIFDDYRSSLKDYLPDTDYSPYSPEGNGHVFYIKTEHRARLIAFLKSKKIQAFFHYVPLHSAPYGQQHTSFIGEDRHTTVEANKLLRLPIYYDLKEQAYISETLISFLSR